MTRMRTTSSLGPQTWFVVTTMATIVLVVFGIFWWQLWRLQVVQAQDWTDKAERNRTVRVVQRAPRGRILDRYDAVIADNNTVYTVQETIDNRMVERIISQPEAVDLMATAPARVRKNYVREYPFGPVLSHVAGYIQKPFVSSDIVYGRSGIEEERNDALAGRDGWTVYERSARGEARRVLQVQEAEVGTDIKTTLDAELSRVAFDALGDKRGAVVVSLPETGDVLVLVSKPSFLPETNPTDEMLQQWQSDIERGSVAPSISQALEWEQSPFLFRPTGAMYPPGSVYKMVTALAGLERDVIDRTTLVEDTGELKVGDFTYQNWYWRQYGRVEGDVDVVQALARSNDIFFYKLAEWIGPDALADFSQWFSLGEPTGFDLGRESSGLVPNPGWKQQRFGERWYLGNTYHMGIGQGDLLVTPLQVQAMMSTVATGGRRCEPHIFTDHQVGCQEVSLRDESLALVIQGLRAACSPGGTAFPFFQTPYDVMCKTGTAEFGAENEQGHRPTHGWLTVALSNQERQPVEATTFSADIVISVIVESDETDLYREGSEDAAPVAKAVADWWWENRARSIVQSSE